jgi:hypothetical protein
VSDKQGPTDDELLRFVDADLSPEQMERIDEHLAGCGVCAARAAALRALIEDVRAPVPAPDLDVGEHVASVMSRLDAPVEGPGVRRLSRWAGALAAAAGLALYFGYGAGDERAGYFTARGGGEESSPSREVGVQLYAHEGALKALQAGDRVRPGTPLTAGLRNLGRESVYLLLFAIDAHNDVHWIAPEFTVAGEDPAAVVVAHSAEEKLLPSAAAFDDLAPGRLRVVAVIGKQPARVSAVESLSKAELDGDGLMKRFPEAEVRQFLLDVTP